MRDVLRGLLALNAEEEASYFTTEVYPPSAINGRSYRENIKIVIWIFSARVRHAFPWCYIPLKKGKRNGYHEKTKA